MAMTCKEEEGIWKSCTKTWSLPGNLGRGGEGATGKVLDSPTGLPVFDPGTCVLCSQRIISCQRSKSYPFMLVSQSLVWYLAQSKQARSMFTGWRDSSKGHGQTKYREPGSPNHAAALTCLLRLRSEKPLSEVLILCEWARLVLLKLPCVSQSPGGGYW